MGNRGTKLGTVATSIVTSYHLTEDYTVFLEYLSYHTLYIHSNLRSLGDEGLGCVKCLKCLFLRGDGGTGKTDLELVPVSGFPSVLGDKIWMCSRNDCRYVHRAAAGKTKKAEVKKLNRKVYEKQNSERVSNLSEAEEVLLSSATTQNNFRF